MPHRNNLKTSSVIIFHPETADRWRTHRRKLAALNVCCSCSFPSSCICEHAMWGCPKIRSRMEPESCWLLSTKLKHTQPGVDLGGAGFLPPSSPPLCTLSLLWWRRQWVSMERRASVVFLNVGGKFSDGATQTVRCALDPEPGPELRWTLVWPCSRRLSWILNEEKETSGDGLHARAAAHDNNWFSSW